MQGEGQNTMKWSEIMKKAIFKPTSESQLRVADDRYGYAVQGKPRFFLRRWFERLIAKTSMPENQQRVLQELAAKGTSFTR